MPDTMAGSHSIGEVGGLIEKYKMPYDWIIEDTVEAPNGC